MSACQGVVISGTNSLRNPAHFKKSCNSLKIDILLKPQSEMLLMPLRSRLRFTWVILLYNDDGKDNTQDLPSGSMPNSVTTRLTSLSEGIGSMLAWRSVVPR